MDSRWSARRGTQETGRRAMAMTAIFLVFGFVVVMVLLGQNLLAATAAAGATGMTAANLARRLTSDDVPDRSEPTESAGEEPETEHASQ